MVQPSYVDAFAHATVARVLVAAGKRSGDDATLGEACDLAHAVQGAAAIRGWRTMEIDAAIAGATARWARGDAAGAQGVLSRAVELADPEGYVRIFLDEGPAIAQVLEGVGPAARATPLVARLLAAQRQPRTPAGEHRLVDALSRRELEVLRLLATDLSGPAIAAELVVSLNTVRTHTKNIFAKLGVSSRRAAVRRANELELLPH